MQYLYHLVPKEMWGSVLYPLNDLRGHSFEIYQREVKKYEGRKDAMEREIVPLKCLWNDVLHMSAIHPGVILEALKGAGHPGRSFSAFMVPLDALDENSLIVYANKEYVPFQKDKYHEYARLSEYTRNYYRKEVEKGNKPLLFRHVTHILYKGCINTSDLEVVTV